MTTTLRTNQWPVPVEDEITFPALQREAFVVLTDSKAGDEVAAVVHAVAPGPVSVPPVGQGYHTMAGMAQVRAALLPLLEHQAPDLLHDEWLASGLPADGPYRVGRTGRASLGHVAESVTFAVTRRISRESHQTALIIERVARTLLTVRRRCPAFAAGLTLLIPDLHRWDRPSLRCLYRLVLVAEPSDRVSVVALAQPDAPTGTGQAEDPTTRIGPARTRFLDRMAATGVVRLIPASRPSQGRATDQTDRPVGGALPPAPQAGTEAEDGASVETTDDIPDRYPDLLLAIGDALVFQNYERVYYLARYALDRAGDDEQRSQAYRLVAIADAQLDELALAAQNLDRATALTGDRTFAAHLHYLQGLIATKRHYHLDAADVHYARGLDALDDGGSDSGHRGDSSSDAHGAVQQEAVGPRVERAWLYNGQALVMTLRAKADTDQTRRDRLLATAFDLELRAFALVRGVPGAAAAYLRHNLMANLTFLLEISQRFTDAVRFWSRAFEAYLASDSREFQVAFDARLGLLMFKAGQREEGLALLEQARTVCREAADPFGEEELCLKLGYAYAAHGDHDSAYRAYREGLRIGHTLREVDICQDALAGMLWSLAELGAVDSLDALRATVVDALPRTWLAQRLRTVPAQPRGGEPVATLAAAGLPRPVPSPKLRAYIPAVDLEGTPTQDLNRYLVWGAGALPRRQPQHTASDPTDPTEPTGRPA